MDEYERLGELMRDQPFLVADGATAEVRLVSQKEALRLMAGAGLFQSNVIMNVEKALENFVQLVGKSGRTFSLKDIAAMTSTPYSQAYNWVAENVVVPSVRAASGKGTEAIFSWTDGFIAGVCGSLRRNGVRLEMLRKVAPLFLEEKQTAQPVATAERS